MNFVVNSPFMATPLFWHPTLFRPSLLQLSVVNPRNPRKNFGEHIGNRYLPFHYVTKKFCWERTGLSRTLVVGMAENAPPHYLGPWMKFGKGAAKNSPPTDEDGERTRGRFSSYDVCRINLVTSGDEEHLRAWWKTENVGTMNCHSSIPAST